MASCGVWSTARRLVAAVVDGDGVELVPVARFDRSEEGWWQLAKDIDTRIGLDCLLVLQQHMSHDRAATNIVADRAAMTRFASVMLTDQLRPMLGLRRPTSRHYALMLARLPICQLTATRLVVPARQQPLL